jgi:hypothetical protein
MNLGDGLRIRWGTVITWRNEFALPPRDLLRDVGGN